MASQAQLDPKISSPSWIGRRGLKGRKRMQELWRHKQPEA
ncbi:uncharacterized protein G2W53_032275 [Senna tora]|uniref:Uncharacterized protein n=1 Tax=Senna tora TaxID=362788 RepID=A0A834SWG1_9FABA|nr:uncharacterized protein G2W53_032275 [Senna tora]